VSVGGQVSDAVDGGGGAVPHDALAGVCVPIPVSGASCSHAARRSR
jgi:hypothetical protein